MHPIIDRAIGAAKLDIATYEAVGHDKSATWQAGAIVILSSLVASIGAAIGFGPLALVATAIGALVEWVLWAGLLWLIGTQFAPEAKTQADLGQLLRTLGFAASPGMLRIFIFIPLIGPIIAFIASLWMVVTMVVAARQALDYTSTLRAVGVCIAGWFIAAVTTWLFLGSSGLGVGSGTGMIG